MDKIKEEINSFLDGFDNELEAIKKYGIKYLKYSSTIGLDKSIKIGHNPVIAPENYMIVLYEGINSNWIEKFKNNTKINIPSIYQNLLLKINGFFIFDITLYGLTPSIYTEGLLDRKILQCLSLDSANTQWIKEYKLDKKYFYIGGRPYNYEENIGYFIIDNKIQTILNNGKIITEYKNIKDFLTEEIKIAEKMYFEENNIEELK
jgi:hypothetical protein